jgi:hypothetical protein
MHVSGQYKMTKHTMSDDTHVTDVRGFVHKTTNLVCELKRISIERWLLHDPPLSY